MLSEVVTAVLEGRAQINQRSGSKLHPRGSQVLDYHVVNSVYLFASVYLKQNMLKQERD